MLTYLRLEEAKTVIQEQSDLIDEKETFGEAMEALLDKTAEFEGTRFGTLVPLDTYELYASQAWAHRWDGEKVAADTAKVNTALDELDAKLAAAAEQVASNASGTAYEKAVDALGGGWVTTAIDDADALCEDDVLGCVTSDDPYTVHIDKADSRLPWMTDFIRSGLAYHEFAHVLQFTNPEQTEAGVASFDGDFETMADCFALTYLKGWKLDHTVWVSDFEYYEVSVGYGYTCNSKQRAAIREWYDSLVFAPRAVSQ